MPQPIVMKKPAMPQLVNTRKAAEILGLRQNLSLKPMQPRRQGGPAVANILRAKQAEGWVLRKTLLVVEVLITSQAAVDRLAQQIRQRQLRVLAATRIG